MRQIGDLMNNDERKRLEDKVYSYADAREFHSEAECDGLWTKLMSEMDRIQIRSEEDENLHHDVEGKGFKEEGRFD